MPEHWILRVQDGENFRNSNYPFWGVKPVAGMEGKVKKLNEGDILWFLTSKNYGGKFIGVGEYTGFYNRDTEPLVKLHTFTNKEQNWKGDGNWSIQIHYKNLYITEKQNLTAIIQCPSIIMKYSTFRVKDINFPDLHMHYENFKFYAEPKDWKKIN